MVMKQISSNYLPCDKMVEAFLAITDSCVHRYVEGMGVIEALEQLGGKLIREGASSQEYNAVILQVSILITNHVLQVRVCVCVCVCVCMCVLMEGGKNPMSL